MHAVARVLPLRPQRSYRGQRWPRRFPPTLRSIPTREASGAPAPAAPPPSSAGAPPASSAPPAAAPPPPPVPESGERERAVIEPIAALLGQLLAILHSYPKPEDLTGSAGTVWAVLRMITKLISLHIVQPQHPLKFNFTERPDGALVSLLLDTREGGKEAQENDEKKPAELPRDLAFLANHLSWILGDFDGAYERAHTIQKELKEPTSLSLRLIGSETTGLIACLNSLDNELRQVAGYLGGLGEGASRAAHAARLTRLASYSDTAEERRNFIKESLEAWQELSE